MKYSYLILQPLQLPSISNTMRLPAILSLTTILLPLSTLAAEVTTEYTVQNKCTRKTQRGDAVHIPVSPPSSSPLQDAKLPKLPPQCQTTSPPLPSSIQTNPLPTPSSNAPSPSLDTSPLPRHPRQRRLRIRRLLQPWPAAQLHRRQRPSDQRLG